MLKRFATMPSVHCRIRAATSRSLVILIFVTAEGKEHPERQPRQSPILFRDYWIS